MQLALESTNVFVKKKKEIHKMHAVWFLKSQKLQSYSVPFNHSYSYMFHQGVSSVEHDSSDINSTMFITIIGCTMLYCSSIDENSMIYLAMNRVTFTALKGRA